MSAPISVHVDLRQRQPSEGECLPHPDCCSNCAWGIVNPSSPGYQPGQPLSAHKELPGAYDGLCGFVQPVMLNTGRLGVRRNGKFYAAKPGPVLDAYMPKMGVSLVGK